MGVGVEASSSQGLGPLKTLAFEGADPKFEEFTEMPVS